jgi:hypothetical protein
MTSIENRFVIFTLRRAGNYTQKNHTKLAESLKKVLDETKPKLLNYASKIANA